MYPSKLGHESCWGIPYLAYCVTVPVSTLQTVPLSVCSKIEKHQIKILGRNVIHQIYKLHFQFYTRLINLFLHIFLQLIFTIIRRKTLFTLVTTRNVINTTIISKIRICKMEVYISAVSASSFYLHLQERLHHRPNSTHAPHNFMQIKSSLTA